MFICWCVYGLARLHYTTLLAVWYVYIGQIVSLPEYFYLEKYTTT